MRLGAYVLGYKDAESYIAAVKQRKYRVAYCPEYIKDSTQEKEIEELREVCDREDIVLAEVGTWVNPLSPNVKEAEDAKNYIIDRIRVADGLRARCCVNIVGSQSAETWYGYHPDNFSKAFFDRAVSVYQSIIDEAAPKYTTMAFEIMPYSIPDDTESYLRFLQDLNRSQVSVHLDPANMISSPKLLYRQKEVFDEVVRELGSRIVSVHIKDLKLSPIPFNTRLDEVNPGLGDIDLKYLLKCLSKLDSDLPVMMEHLESDAVYTVGAAYIRQLAGEIGVQV